MVEGVSQTYFGQFCRCTTGTKEHSNTTRIFRAIPLDNPRGANPPSNPTEDPAPPAGVIGQSGTSNNTSGGVTPKSIKAADLGGNPNIGGDSLYDNVSLSLLGHLFIGGAITYESKPPTSNYTDFGAPDF